MGGDRSQNCAKSWGYTLVETTLAMAVAASLFMLTFGLSSMLSNNRFKDTLNRAYVFLRTQYSDVGSGIDSRAGVSSDVVSCSTGNVAGNSSNCYAIGRRIYFYKGGDGISRMASVDLLGLPDALHRTKVEWPKDDQSGIDNLKSVARIADNPDTGNGSSNILTMSQGDIYLIYRFVGTTDNKKFAPGSGNSYYSGFYVDLMRDPKSAQTVYLGDNDGIQDNAVYGLVIKNAGSGSYEAGLVCIGGNNAGGLSYNTNISNSDADNPSAIRSLCNNWEAK